MQIILTFVTLQTKLRFKFQKLFNFPLNSKAFVIDGNEEIKFRSLKDMVSKFETAHQNELEMNKEKDSTCNKSSNALNINSPDNSELKSI